MNELSVLNWYAVYVKPRHEKAVAAVLRGKGYEHLLPLYRPRNARGPGLPLFPSYLFVRLDARHRLPVLSVPGVFFIVGVGKTPAPVDAVEMAAIQTVLDSGCPVQPWPHMRRGDRVRITEGPLRGLEGCFDRHDDAGGCLVVSVSLLQRSIAVNIDASWVEPVSGGALRHLASAACTAR